MRKHQSPSNSKKKAPYYYIERGGEKFGPVPEKSLLKYFRCYFQGDMIRSNEPGSEWEPAYPFIQEFKKRCKPSRKIPVFKILLLMSMIPFIIYVAMMYLQSTIFF